MLFNSLHFLIFLPVVTALYYLLPFRFRWMLIFAASCYFYMALVPAYILILFFIILVDYLSAIAISKAEGRRRKAFLVVSLLSNILLLGFFKYFNFVNENVVHVLSFFGWHVHPVNLSIILPIGLSFHTFQSMSYTLDVYHKRQTPERHLGHFANYVLFFPQMVAGPIERYSRLGESLKSNVVASYDNFSDGFRLVLFGLFVKMTIADNLAPYVNAVFDKPLEHSASQAIMAMVLFSFQIYADFYGYSIVAVGSARLLGIPVMDNFKTPYLSASIGEFWSRWHISLSSWFRDYLYIPLGGNRVPLPRWVLNILIVFIVSGLWHGASWTFVAWGAIHGVMLVLETLFRGKATTETGVRRVFGIAVTFVIVTVAWVFFRASSFGNAWDMFRAAAGGGTSHPAQAAPPVSFAVMLVCLDIFTRHNRIDRRLASYPAAWRWSIYTVLLFGLLALAGTEKFPFIYFQF